MTRYVFNQASNAMALLLELQAAGVRVGSVTPRDATTEVDLEPEDFDRAATVVAAHDKAAADAIVAADERQFLSDVQGLKQYQTIATPTLAQTAAAVKAQSRVLRRVVQELRD